MSPEGERYDAAIRALIDGWEPRLGRPTCAAGCAACCRRTSVHATSAEVAQLLEGLDGLTPRAAELRDAWRRRAGLLRRELASPGGGDPINAVIDQGPCVFLNGEHCSVYPGRPDTCRSFHVWHDASFCGHPGYDMCTPAELSELRTRRFFERMRRECRAGRVPFFGHLVVMLDILDRLADEYSRGLDLRDLVDPVWAEAGLVSFMQATTPDGIEAELAAAERGLAEIYASEPWPQGYPRAAEAASRGDLAAFPLNADWTRPAVRVNR